MQINDQDLAVIAQYEPKERAEESLMKAAVAIVLRDSEQGTEFLLMQRAHHDKDPWSGQMSFPGGKIDPTDDSAKQAAIRETEEEVGIQLTEHDYIGRLDDLYGFKVDNQYSVQVACFVFKPSIELNLRANHEVADMVWLPFSHLNNPNNAYPFYHPSDSSLKMPAVLIDDKKQQVLWGLSLRMLNIFYQLIGKSMHVLSLEEQQTMMEIENRTLDISKHNVFRQKILAKQNQ